MKGIITDATDYVSGSTIFGGGSFHVVAQCNKQGQYIVSSGSSVNGAGPTLQQAPAIVETTPTTATSFTITSSASVPASADIVVFMDYDPGSSPAVPTVSDTLGNTWTKSAQQTACGVSHNLDYSWVFYTHNGVSAGSDTVTMTFSVAAFSFAAREMAVFSNVAGTFDAPTFGFNTSASGNVATELNLAGTNASANEVELSMAFSCASEPVIAGPGWTQILNTYPLDMTTFAPTGLAMRQYLHPAGVQATWFNGDIAHDRYAWVIGIK
jgi:hypothetical protein